ncbi:MAG: hypothetical protein ACLS4A_08800 [Oscillospiraceae bacterium]
MEILYQNANILVCIKPARVLSTDEPGDCQSWCGKLWATPRPTCARCTGLTGWSAA